MLRLLGPQSARRLTGRRRICNLFLLVFLLAIGSLYLAIDKVINSGDQNVVDDDVMFVIRDTKDQKEYIDKKGIHVIVGQYVGATSKWSDLTGPNLTEEILNANNYAPQPRAGQNGLPVYVPEFDSAKARVLFHVNKFNLMASDRISVNRTLLDPRKESCRAKIYDTRNLPTSSVIIVFHNEAWSTLLRTVHSVLNRTPKTLLKEVILVDDASERKFLKQPLDDYLATLNEGSNRTPVHLIRAINRTGLIRARLLGAAQSKGQVLVFLDAHCEATIGWLEPLVHRIHEDRTRVVCPVIDIIHDETFAYAKSFELHWGAFNWNMHFRWFALGHSEYNVHKLQDTLPFRTPIMAGGLFAMDKSYFYELGAYDEDMDIWGGENIELSLRVWTCGGRVEVSPCSRVGHLFRKSSPYSFPREGGVANVLYSNLARVLEVWFDEYKEFFYRINPVARKTVFGELDSPRTNEAVFKNIDKRKELRNRLKCRPFSWFLENVWPEHFLPATDRFFGQIKNAKYGHCVQRPNSKGDLVGKSPVGRLELEPCAIELYSAQMFVYTKSGFLMSDESTCVDVPDARSGGTVMLLACSEMSRQKWKVEPALKRLKHVQSGLCVDIASRTGKFLVLAECETNQRGQRWDMVSIDWA